MKGRSSSGIVSFMGKCLRSISFRLISFWGPKASKSYQTEQWKRAALHAATTCAAVALRRTRIREPLGAGVRSVEVEAQQSDRRIFFSVPITRRRSPERGQSSSRRRRLACQASV